MTNWLSDFFFWKNGGEKGEDEKETKKEKTPRGKLAPEGNDPDLPY